MRPLHRGVARFPALFLASHLLFACGSEGGVDAAPGYNGPYPSAAAQSALNALKGVSVELPGLVPEGRRLTIERFGVVPNLVTGKGPVVLLREPASAALPHDPKAPQGADGRWILPVLTDGDAADLVERATGVPPPNFGGETSPTYRALLEIDDS